MKRLDVVSIHAELPGHPVKREVAGTCQEFKKQIMKGRKGKP